MHYEAPRTEYEKILRLHAERDDLLWQRARLRAAAAAALADLEAGDVAAATKRLTEAVSDTGGREGG
jgi:hypothetical protein